MIERYMKVVPARAVCFKCSLKASMQEIVIVLHSFVPAIVRFGFYRVMTKVRRSLHAVLPMLAFF